MRKAFGVSPTDPQSGEAARSVAHDNSRQLHPRVALKFLNQQQDLRGMLARATNDAHRVGVFGRSERDTGDVRGGVDGEPLRAHACATSFTIRRAGSASYESWKCRSSGGAPVPARSGPSIRTIATLPIMSSKPRSRASSG